MAEELEIGKIIIGLRVVLGNTLEVLSSVKTTLEGMARVSANTENSTKGVGTAFKSTAQDSRSMNTALGQTEKQLDVVSKKAAEAKNTLAAAGTQTEGLDKYAGRIKKIDAEIEKTHKEFLECTAQLERFEEQVKQTYRRSEKYDSSLTPEAFSKQNSQLKDEFMEKVNNVKLLEAELSSLRTVRNEVAEAAIAASKKQSEAAAEAAEKAAERESAALAKLEERQQRADSTLMLSSVAMLMRTVSDTSDGLIGKLSTIATRVLFLKQALKDTARPAAKLGTAIAGGVGIAISVLTALASEAQRVREENIKSAAEAAQAFASSEKENSSLEKNIALLESQSASTEELKRAKQELAQMFPNMVAGYDQEGEAILRTVGALKKEAEYRKLLAEQKTERASAAADINVEQYYESKKKLEAATRLMDNAYDDYEDVIDTRTGEIMDVVSKQKNSDLSTVFGTIFIGEKGANEFNTEMGKFANQKAESIENAVSSIRARIIELCEGNSAVSDMLSDSFFRMDLEDGKLKDGNIDEYAQGIISKYDAVMANVDEDLRTRIFDEGTDPVIFSVFQEKIQQGIEESLNNTDFDLTAFQDKLKTAMETMLNGDLMGDIKIFENLGKKITGGEATKADFDEYDRYLGKIRNSCKSLEVDFNALTNAQNKNAVQLGRSAAQQKGLNSSYLDLAKSTSDCFSAYKNLNKEMSDVNILKAVVNTLKEGKSAKNYGDALAYVADKYNVSKEEAANMLCTLEAELQAKEVLAAANVMLAQTQVDTQIIALQSAQSQAVAMQGADSATAKSIQNMINNLTALQAKMLETFNADGTPKVAPNLSSISIPKVSSGGGGGGRKSGGGGGGGSYKNTALDNELKRLEHKRAMDDLTYSEELAWLERIRSKYAKTAEEKQQLDEKIYAAKKALLEAERNHQKNMDELTLQEEIASIESQMRLYRSGTQARMELEEQLHQAKKDLERRNYELSVYYGKLNLEEQARQLEAMISKYKEGTQARIDLEKELYDIKQQIRQRDVESIDKVAEGITEALRNRYEQQRDAERERIEDSKKSWQDWSDAQIKALQEQMDALDELSKQEDQAEEERKRRRKIAALEQAVKYESDDYNRKNLEKQLEAAKKDLDDYLNKIDREKQKEALKDEQDRIREQAEKEQKLLDSEWEAKNKEYEEYLKAFNLKAEAEKMLMQGNQEEILDIIKSYAPEYDMVGQTLGEKLVDGFSSQVKDIQAWLESLTDGIREQQRLMAIVANQAADNYIRRQQERERANRVQVVEPKQISLVVNINKEIGTPAELRSELERMIEDMSDM